MKQESLTIYYKVIFLVDRIWEQLRGTHLKNIWTYVYNESQKRNDQQRLLRSRNFFFFFLFFKEVLFRFHCRLMKRRPL